MLYIIYTLHQLFTKLNNRNVLKYILKQKYLGVNKKMDVDWKRATVKLVEFFFSTIQI